MTPDVIDSFSEDVARVHLQTWHPAVTAVYAAEVRYRMVLLDLREVVVQVSECTDARQQDPQRRTQDGGCGGSRPRVREHGPTSGGGAAG